MIGATRIFRAPGRVNLIGEHTDYNLGYVFPIALQLETRVEVRPTDDGVLRVLSAARGESRTWTVADVARLEPARDWGDYVAGVAREIARRGIELPSAELRIESTVPEGAGLSSSAALEVATALALLGDRPVDRLEIARLCQSAERDFVGVPCGIMDQYTALFGYAGSAIQIDCRSLESRSVPLPSGVSIVAVNSMVKHALGDSAYRTRVAECAEACEAMGVESLRDATAEMVEKTRLNAACAARARHVVTENARVVEFAAAAGRGDCERMGRLFAESHASMRDDYEISCPEIDFLVEATSEIPGCYGARMTGGGFGGCTVNLVKAGMESGFGEAIRRLYQAHWGILPEVIECRASEGAGETAQKKV